MQDSSNLRDGIAVHLAAFSRLGAPDMAAHLREEHHQAVPVDVRDRATLLAAHWIGHDDPPGDDRELWEVIYIGPTLPGDREAVHVCDDQCGHGEEP